MKKVFHLVLLVLGVPAFAGTTVLGGDAVLTGATGASLDAKTATESYAQIVSSGGRSAVLDWSAFNVLSGKEMNFAGAETTFFNLVDGASKSQIDGIISGNGSVWVINPNGVAFGAGAQVNVGGIFAAAAGNISNADALRDGTANAPAFSSMSGAVTAEAGARFSADQVALLGKTVSAAGDFTGVNSLTVHASEGTVTVDDVGGGKVSVNLGDFAATDAEVSLGDLEVGGELAVKSAGAIVQSGTAIKAGDVALEATGNIKLTGAQNDFTGEVSARGGLVFLKDANAIKIKDAVATSDYLAISAGDDIEVGGAVTGASGTQVYSVGGNIKILKDASVTATGADAKVDLTTGFETGRGGGVTVDGKVAAEQGDVDIYTGYYGGTTGDIAIDGTVDAAGKVSLWTGFGYYEDASGSVSVNGSLSGSSVDVKSVNDVTIGEKATVSASGDAALVTIRSGYNTGAEGNITVSGQVTAKGTETAAATGVKLYSGYGYTAKGDITIDANGGIETDGQVYTYSGLGYFVEGSGATYINGKVSGDSMVSVNVRDGNLMTGVGSSVASSSGYTFLNADHGHIDIAGDVTSGMGVQAESAAGAVVVEDDGEVNSGIIILNGKTGVYNYGTLDATDGSLIVDGNNGDVDLGGVDGGVIKAKDFSAISSKSIKALNVNNKITGEVETYGQTVNLAQAGDIHLSDVAAESALEVSVTEGNITVDGTVTAPELVGLYTGNGNLTVNEGASVTAVGDGALIDLRAGVAEGGTGTLVNHGELHADKVSLVSSAGIVHSGKIEAESVALVDAGTGLTVDGAVSGKTVNLYATDDLVLGGNAAVKATGLKTYDDGVGGTFNTSIDIASREGSAKVQKGATLVATAEEAGVYVSSYAQGEKAEKGGVVMDGTITARTENGGGAGTITITSNSKSIQVNGTMDAGGQVSAVAYAGDIKVGGTIASDTLAFVNAMTGDLTVNGKVRAGSMAMASAGGASVVNGQVVGGDTAVVFAGKRGIAINGQVTANGAGGNAMLVSEGDVRFSSSGRLTGTEYASVYASGNVTQDGVYLPYNDGRMDAVILRPAASGKEVVVQVGGSIGGGKYAPFVIDGKVYAIAFGDMSLAAAYGKSLQGGNASSVAAARESAQYSIASARRMLEGSLTYEEALARVLNPSDFDDNALLYSAGDMYLYTAGRLDANSFVGAGGNMTVSAAQFGDMSYLQSGGTLTINNVGKPAYPQVAYFESIDGVEPTINNLPNDVVIFVDGRLAGGNLRILNQFGADEAFLVQTPELKSTQGIFGNPTFLHSDLDVANPMEVSAIDYLLQETPILTLSKDFPSEVDQHVDSVAIPERDSIQFGRKMPDAAPADRPEEKAVSEPTADDKVVKLPPQGSVNYDIL